MCINVVYAFQLHFVNGSSEKAKLYPWRGYNINASLNLALSLVAGICHHISRGQKSLVWNHIHWTSRPENTVWFGIATICIWGYFRVVQSRKKVQCSEISKLWSVGICSHNNSVALRSPHMTFFTCPIFHDKKKRQRKGRGDSLNIIHSTMLRWIK